MDPEPPLHRQVPPLADLPVPATSPADARAIADSVLSRQEFADAQPRWWERILRVLSDWWVDLVDAVGGGGRGSVIGLVVLLGVVAAAVFVVLRLTRGMRRDPGVDMALDVGIGRTTRDWVDEALEHEARGRWRDAVRCRYRALLADLAAAGLIDEIAGRTAGEYLAAVRNDVPPAGDAFAEVTRRFEAAWYGQGTTTGDDVAAFRQAAGHVAGAAGLRRSLVGARS